MAMPPVGRLLISHIKLRGPELRQLYQVISRRLDISYEDLRHSCVVPVTSEDVFGLQEATLRETLDFLVSAGLVDQQGSARRKANFRVTPALPNVTFPL